MAATISRCMVFATLGQNKQFLVRPSQLRSSRSLRSLRRVVQHAHVEDVPPPSPIPEKTLAKKVTKSCAATKTEKIKFHTNEDNKYERLAYTLTPLWKHPYALQLHLKFKDLSFTMRKLGKLMKAAKIGFPEDPHGLPCPLRPVLPSPITEAYRNKDEFSVRQGPSGEPKTVGFIIGSPADGEKVVCVSPEHLIICKASHKRVAKAFQDYIQRSPLPGCYETGFNGYWKNIVVRSNRNGDIMAIIIMHPQQLSEGELEEEKGKLKDFFVHGSGKECQIKSLYFQACPHTRCSHEQAPFQLLHGEPFIVEDIAGIKFRISPESFFQVNAEVATYLYDTVHQMLNCTPDTTLLDICCGTGTISLTQAKHLHSTFGIDASAQAVQDATFTAQLNGITNAKFAAGRAEVLIPSVRNEFFCEDICAVMNPGRGGLPVKAIRALREYHQIKRLIYISCKPDGAALDNFIELCKISPKSREIGPPFRPLVACPVDMFPHTRHTELVMLFGRS
ncbi:tRNA (uracil-5-)-methyltransferase homolog B-like [Ornithodoros turicata]|uniref:tRNA (uracil-5-)-methyltransferase homolog B-like n=1 Tax=Ornithodoros turicata TaxID=34597 RepID=UPI0031388921